MCWALSHPFVPRFPVGVRIAAEAGQQLLLHLRRVKLRQAGQVKICNRCQWITLKFVNIIQTILNIQKCQTMNLAPVYAAPAQARWSCCSSCGLAPRSESCTAIVAWTPQPPSPHRGNSASQSLWLLWSPAKSGSSAPRHSRGRLGSAEGSREVFSKSTAAQRRVLLVGWSARQLQSHSEKTKQNKYICISYRYNIEVNKCVIRFRVTSSWYEKLMVYFGEKIFDGNIQKCLLTSGNLIFDLVWMSL